ncbi:hypothetical protein JS44_03505 [Anoxybacillus flavithermus]|uniref:Uncharacterized protein n=1 Tax=Anoxybacillus flavithermus TaxID=33934 RepID=A0A094J375_9BACL|nr:hypothetical protein JS44_03505 [Anoxybacillus flavithermus]
MGIYDANFENLLNEFEHACRVGDYKISRQLRREIFLFLDNKEEEIANVLRDLCLKIEWLGEELVGEKQRGQKFTTFFYKRSD